MTTNDDTNTTPPPIPEPQPPENLTPGSAIETLLKKPMDLLAYVKQGRSGRLIACLSISAVICLLVFGFIAGLFSKGDQLWAAPLKITAGLLLSGLICLPSLYIFGCLNGLDLKLTTMLGILVSSICLASLLLIGFAPVVWIFSQSTNSVVFMGFLLLSFWAIALYFGLSLLFKAGKHLGGQPRGHLVVWALIFTLVTLQMSTALRPIVGTADTLLPEEKKFFLVHWIDEIRIPRTDKRGWK